MRNYQLEANYYAVICIQEIKLQAIYLRNLSLSNSLFDQTLISFIYSLLRTLLNEFCANKSDY